MKIDKSRFTIRFNEADPRQLKAMEILETAGRRKASLIADAICYFMAKDENGEGIAATIILPSISSTVQTLPNCESPEANNEPPPHALEPLHLTHVLNPPDEKTFDNDMRNAVMEGLGAFNF